MKTTEFTMPEITISYKDNVKASERMKILSSETSYSYLKHFYSECMWKIQCKLPPKTKRFCPLVLK